MNQSWNAKKKLSDYTSNSAVDELIDSLITSGAIGVKLSGAGGGGFVLIYVKAENRLSVEKHLEHKGCQVFPFSFWEKGCEAWSVGCE